MYENTSVMLNTNTNDGYLWGSRKRTSLGQKYPTTNVLQMVYILCIASKCIRQIYMVKWYNLTKSGGVFFL